MQDGFYWIEWDGDTLVAERLGGAWYLPGFEDDVSIDEVTILAGPIAQPLSVVR